MALTEFAIKALKDVLGEDNVKGREGQSEGTEAEGREERQREGGEGQSEATEAD